MSIRIKTTIEILLIVFAIAAGNYIFSQFFATKNIAASMDDAANARNAVREGLLYYSLIFLAVGAIIAFFASRIVSQPYYKIETQNRNLETLNETIRAQAEQINDANEQKKTLLNAMPFACNLWDINGNVFECTEETLRLFALKNKQEFLDHFYDFLPKYQPDGSLSYEKSKYLLKKVFEEGGRVTTEWTYQTLDGTPLPAEVTLVRVPHDGTYAVAAYARDLREHKKIMSEIERRDNLLNTVNLAANVLLQSESSEFENALRRCMGMIGMSVGVDRVCIWKNQISDGQLHCFPIYEWLENAEPHIRENGITASFPFNNDIPKWVETLSQGKYINRNVSAMTPEERNSIPLLGALSIFVIPVFVHDQFWGVVGFDNCHSEKVFSEDEASVLRSGGILIAHALLRNEMTLNIQTTAAQLENALNDARNANAAKSNFLARMSHEIRTPLNAVIGLSELTLEIGGLNNEAYANLEKICNSGTMLLNIVNDILDISKIEAGKLELLDVDYDIPSLINDTVAQSIMRLEDKPVEFILSIDENLPHRLYGDDLRIKQIINNLLSNAFKYTRKGTVEFGVRCERESGTDTIWMTIFVRDTGIGIHPEDISRLFENYTKMDEISNRAVEGIGLGLSITKMLVEMMDGSITVESEYGEGSTFKAKFRQRLVDNAVIGPEIVHNLKELRYSNSKRASQSQLARIRLPYARVLVVDDNATNLDVAKGMMQAYGMKIDCVSGGQQAIDAIRNENFRYDAIFMDHMMPGIDGIEATRIIREEIGTDYARTVPIIALTANAIIGNKEMFLSKGFQDFIPKPIELSRMDTVIRKWIRNKEMKKDLDDQQIIESCETFIERRNNKDRRVNGNGSPTGNGLGAEWDGNSGVDRRQIFDEIEEIPGLNTREGLERFGGDEKIYHQVLRSYVTNTRLILGTIKEINEDNLEEYIFAVHGIKASSRGIGANRVGGRAEALEKAARDGNMDFLRENHPAFLVAAEELMIAIGDMLEKASANKPNKDKPDAEILSRIRAACESYDIDELDAAMAEMEACEYESDGGLAVWLRENVDRMNYTEIIDKLS